MSNHTGTWLEVEVAGKPCDIYEPADRNEHGHVLIYLHGVHLNRLIDKQPFIDQFAKHGLPVIAPMTGPTWWTDRISPVFDSETSAEGHVLDCIVPFIFQRWQVEPPRIGLFGTSMGGQGALRFAYKHPAVFPVVAGISPAIDYHTRIDEGDSVLLDIYGDTESARQDTALLHIHPLNWPRHQFFCCCPHDHRWHDGADRLRMKLGSLGVPYECDLETVGGGHGFGYYNLMAAAAIGFVADRLQQM